jgi:hypothetical protein
MSEEVTVADAVPKVKAGSVFGGVAFMVFWAVGHVVLFYGMAVSGILIDVFLGVLKSVMLPGKASTGAHEMMGWEGTLRAGLIVAGVAGIPGGMAMFGGERRKLLGRLFWLVLGVGVVLELVAVFILVRNAFTVPA